MALMLSRLYDALRLANVPEDKAREAAEEIATYEQVRKDTYLLKWMVGVLIASSWACSGCSGRRLFGWASSRVCFKEAG